LALHQITDQDPSTRSSSQHLRDAKTGLVRPAQPEFLLVLGLNPIVALFPQSFAKLAPVHAVLLPTKDQRAQAIQRLYALQVGIEGGDDPRVLHLDRDQLAVAERRP